MIKKLVNDNVLKYKLCLYKLFKKRPIMFMINKRPDYDTEIENLILFVYTYIF